MTLSSISRKNIKKSYKDYAIYFLTLILGVAIFYVFNSIESQQAMFRLTERKEMVCKVLVSLMSGVSVILGFLIVYSNGFLIRKRKKEFGIYMILGMGKKDISRILFGETLIIGSISLVVGLAIGIFASQFMSILLGKMFEADLESYQFIFSGEATVKTVLYFGIMFLMVVFFNAVAIGRFKLVDLLSASRKNQSVKMKNPVVCVSVFLMTCVVLGYCYYAVTIGVQKLTETKALIVIGLGSVCTYLVFWSLSGFFLTIIKKQKAVYLKGLNAFVLRQLNNKINTMVFTMSLICLMLFVSIGAISSGMTLRNIFNDKITLSVPADVEIAKDIKDSTTVEEDLKNAGLQPDLFADYVEVKNYTDKELTLQCLLDAERLKQAKEEYRYESWDIPVEIYPESEFNKLAKYYGLQTFSLEAGQYVAIANFQKFADYQNASLSKGHTIIVEGKEYRPQYKTCRKGMTEMGSINAVYNIVILPDEAFLSNEGMIEGRTIFAANYKANGKKEIEAAEEDIQKIIGKLEKNSKIENLHTCTKIEVKESGAGISVIATYVGLYIGIIFLITSAALLALKELSEAAENRERYQLLRKLGTEESMIHRALFKQIGVFFFLPLFIAMIHSVFGIQFVNNMIVFIADQHILKPVAVSALIYGIMYLIYFIATYFGSKRILEE